MKNFIIAMAACLTVSLSTAQNQINSSVDWSPDVYQIGKKYSGYIIKLDGDTVDGYIEALARTSIQGMGNSNQNKVNFYLKETDKKPAEKYKADDIKGYLIADKLYESINYSGGLFNKPNFNLVVKEGAIRQYEWYSTVDGFAGMRKQSGESWMDFDARRYTTELIIAKDPKEPINYSMLALSFAKKMPDMINDNKEMAKKVANKESGYKWINFFDVIDEYNAWAEENK